MYTHHNQPILLTDILGQGGEAVIYQVLEYPDQVAKIYHTPTPEREAKLQAMLANPPQQPPTHTAIVWPTQLLYQDDAFKGFLMPKITSPHIGPIFDIYNPSRRRMLHPKVDSRLLYEVALELVNTVAAIHAKGHVIGDVNESNILVYLYKPEKTIWTQLRAWWQERADITPYVTFVDTDSFQIRAQNGKLYRSLVAKPEYTPPELHGVNFSDIDQQVEHDMFRVAVLLFQLLMEGFHPFSGVLAQSESVGRVDLHNIRQGVFPYYPTIEATPPPHAPQFGQLFPALQTAFVHCFVGGHDTPTLRPSAVEWRNLLEAALNSFITCDHNHGYGHHLLHCPYCEPKRPIPPVIVEAYPLEARLMPPREVYYGPLAPGQIIKAPPGGQVVVKMPNYTLTLIDAPTTPPPPVDPKPTNLLSAITVDPKGSGAGVYRTLAQAVQAIAEGGTITLSAGQHRVDGLVISKSVKLIGQGLEQTMIIGAAKRMETALKFTGSQLTMSDLSIQAKVSGKINLLQVYGKIDLQRCGFFKGNIGLYGRQNSSGEVQTCHFEDNVPGMYLTDQTQMTLHHNLCQNNDIAIQYSGQAGGLARQNRCINNNVGISSYFQATPLLEQNECRQNKHLGISCGSKETLRANECHENGITGIRVSSPDALIERNHCTKNGQDGLECLGYGMRSIISGNVCRENGRHGISIREGAAPTLSQNLCQLNPQAGLSYQDTASGTASENQCSQNGAYGIRVVDRAKPVLERNVCQQNKSHGLSYLGQAAGVARDNRCHQNGTEGIRVEGQAAPTLSHNFSQQNQRSGLVYAGKSAGEAKGNHCIANRQAGIRVIGQAQPLLEGNYCQLNQGAAISYEGQAQGIARQNRYISNGTDEIKRLGTAHPQLTDNAVDSMPPLNLLESLQPDHLSTMIAQAADGAILELPPGEYRLSQMLELTKSMQWRGAGIAKTIIIGQPQAVIEIKNSRFSAQGITFRYEYEQGAQQPLMTIKDGEINLIECHFDNGLYGLLLQGSTTGTVTSCIFTHNHVGLRLIDQVTPQLQENQCQENNFGMEIIGQAKPTISRNMCQDNTQVGLIFMGQAQGLVEYNQINRSKLLSGIIVKEQACPGLVSNEGRGNKQSGIAYFDQARGTARQNKLSQNESSGIYVAGNALPLLEHNECYENSWHGVQINEQAQPTLKQNLCHENKMSGLVYFGNSGGSARQNRLIENQVDGIVIGENAAPTLEQNECQRNKCHGLEVGGMAKPTIINNRSEQNGYSGLAYYGNSGGLARQNRLIENQLNGIYVGQTAAPNLEQNECHRNIKFGINIYEQAQPTVTANICQANQLSGIIVSGEAAPLIVNNLCHENKESGLAYFGQSGGTARQNRLIENQLNGIYVGQTAAPNLEQNECHRNIKFGINIYEQAQPTVTANICQANQLSGIGVGGAAAPLIVNNLCHENKEAGLAYFGQSGGTARQNQFSNNGLHGISVNETVSPLLEKNQCQGNKYSGIAYYGQSGGTARQNYCQGNGQGNIQVYNQANPKLEDNKCS